MTLKRHIFKMLKKVFLSHAPRIIQSKKQVYRSKGVLCSSGTNGQTERHESENIGHPFRVSGFIKNPSTYHQGAVQFRQGQMFQVGRVSLNKHFFGLILCQAYHWLATASMNEIGFRVLQLTGLRPYHPFLIQKIDSSNVINHKKQSIDTHVT